MVVRAATVTLRVRDKNKNAIRLMTLNVVSATERGRVPKGEKRLQWLLLTNHPIQTLDEAIEVVHGYCQRWRIEEFHRTWLKRLRKTTLSCSREAVQPA